MGQQCPRRRRWSRREWWGDCRAVVTWLRVFCWRGWSSKWTRKWWWREARIYFSWIGDQEWRKCWREDRREGRHWHEVRSAIRGIVAYPSKQHHGIDQVSSSRPTKWQTASCSRSYTALKKENIQWNCQRLSDKCWGIPQISKVEWRISTSGSA